MDNKPSSAGATLVTGAAGFVGRALVSAMKDRAVRRALRRSAAEVFPGDTIVGDISPVTEWGAALDGVECVVHLAARTHVLHEVATDPLASYRQINVEATRHLAQQAATAGVRRFVFLSSIKVNGEATTDRPYTELDAPAPEDAYGISKLEGEDMLHDISARSGMEVVILRPPLIYGTGVKGNVLRLLQWIDLGLPLPLASVHNSRSMIHVGNLAEAITTCIDTPAAANRTFLVSDGTDLSTPELIHWLAAGMGRTAHLLPCPVGLLQLGATLLGQSDAVARLTGSLRVDSTLLRNTLGWRPRIQPDQGLIDTGRWYHQARIQRRT